MVFQSAAYQGGDSDIWVHVKRINVCCAERCESSITTRDFQTGRLSAALHQELSAFHTLFSKPDLWCHSFWQQYFCMYISVGEFCGLLWKRLESKGNCLTVRDTWGACYIIKQLYVAVAMWSSLSQPHKESDTRARHIRASIISLQTHAGNQSLRSTLPPARKIIWWTVQRSHYLWLHLLKGSFQNQPVQWVMRGATKLQPQLIPWDVCHACRNRLAFLHTRYFKNVCRN